MQSDKTKKQGRKETTMVYCYIPIRMAKIKTTPANADKGKDQHELSFTAGGNAN